VHKDQGPPAGLGNPQSALKPEEATTHLYGYCGSCARPDIVTVACVLVLTNSTPKPGLTTIPDFFFSTFQRFNISAFQLFSFSAFQHFSISAFQHFSISAFQHFSFSAFQHFSFFPQIHPQQPTP
jgi:hypothetical protein